MKLPVVFVRGIRDDGDDNFFMLATELENLHGIECLRYAYKHNRLLDQRSQAKRNENAEGLISFLDGRRCHLACHSNGGLVTLDAMDLGAKFARCFFFGPALDDDVQFPKGCAERINIIHNPHDRAITLARILRKHPYGALGQRGYQGKFNPIVHSIAARVKGTIDRNEHSHYGRSPFWRQHWADYMAERVT